MHLLSYIIWNASPDIFSLPVKFWIFDFTLTLRWYGLLFALGFLISQQILYYIFKKEGKPEKDVDTLTIYMVVATVIGARLGHVLFYEPERYLSNPIDIIKIWEGGLASHGATVGILLALWLYSRKKIKIMSEDGKSILKVDRRPNQNYLQTLDRIVILVALTGALIRFGNFMNSEIIGKPTHSNYGVMFARNVTEVLTSDGSITHVNYVEQDTASNAEGYRPVKILLEFEKGQVNTLEDYAQYMDNRVDSYLSYNPYIREHISQTDTDYDLSQDETGTTYAIVNSFAIPRHPAQLYESISCVFLFGFLFWLWTKHKEKLPEGRLFSIFLIVCFGLRFLFEFLKENQVDFENSLPLNMGQLLSIPLVLLGLFMLIRSYRKEKVS